MAHHGSPNPPHAGTGAPSSGPYGGPQTGLSGRGTRFFDWMRSLGVVRADGWVGGVCAGVAYRIGIDPLIVRGIVVVAAVLGAPALLLYALAWALLPDRDGRIHLQQLFEGDFEPPIVAIGVLLVLSLLPWRGLWWFDGPFDDGAGIGGALGHVLWILIVLGAATALIVVAVRNANARDRASGGVPGAASWRPSAAPGHASSTAAEPTTSSTSVPGAGAPTNAASWGGPATAETANAADAADPAEGVAAPASTAAFAAAPGATAAGSAVHERPTLDIAAEPTAPPAPGQGATPADVADWRARQEQWRAEHAQWKQRLDADMRAVKAQRAAELRSQAAIATAESNARRQAYRAANPRVGAAIGWLAVGLALVAGALTSALWAPLTGLSGYVVTAALAAATLVIGVVVLIAGSARRRSGFLIFLGILLAVLTTASAVLPAPARAALGASTISAGGDVSMTPTGTSSYVQGWGDTTIDLGAAVDAAGTPTVSLAKGPGETVLVIPADATLRLEASTPSEVIVRSTSGAEEAHRCDRRVLGGCTVDLVVGPAGAADVTVQVAQVGDILVQREGN